MLASGSMKSDVFNALYDVINSEYEAAATHSPILKASDPLDLENMRGEDLVRQVEFISPVFSTCLNAAMHNNKIDT